MTNTHDSAFTAIVARLGELTESELRQLSAVVAVRLGQSPAGSAAPTTAGTSSSSTRGSGGGRGRGGNTSTAPGKTRKGNPQRKSQWANHPLYQEYHRLKLICERQAKATGVAFAALQSPEKADYDRAFAAWIAAKQSFRGRDAPHESADDTEESTVPPTEAGPSRVTEA